ncbi:hypothetical protein [Streptomyces sioyaensis]|uniref:hypothetical protein n=1 Tax=Streptomyces sioyaensis TaxID=67364 RepID=UPI0037B19993
MPIDANFTMRFGKHALEATRWSWGTRAAYPPERKGQDGWGTQIEVAAVIEMLDLAIRGAVKPQDIRDRLREATQVLVEQYDHAPDDGEDPEVEPAGQITPASQPQSAEVAVPHQGQSPGPAAWAAAQEHATAARVHLEEMDAADADGLPDERAAHLDLAITYARLARIASEMLPR